MTDRKFNKMVVKVTILSEESFNTGNQSCRQAVSALLNEGPDIGSFEVESITVLDGKQAVEELLNMGSDCTSFCLDAEGNDTDDETKEPSLLSFPERKDVHTEHCCKNCGCKYGDDDCTVVRGVLKQSYPCDGNCNAY